MMLSLLSSSRPEVLLRSIKRSSMTCSVHEKKRTDVERQTCNVVSWRENWKRSAWIYRFVKLDRLIHLAGETVDQEAAVAVLPGSSQRRSSRLQGWRGKRFAHSVLEQLCTSESI